ncbi:MAG: hypothetical protein HS116_20970 [Planctomycetes bacterium]|nr:hypothetical protein [Planctomycetota bacterium]
MKQKKQARLHFFRTGPADVLISKELRPFRALRDKWNRSVHAYVELNQVGIAPVVGSMRQDLGLYFVGQDWASVGWLRTSPHLVRRATTQDEHRSLRVVPTAEHVELSLYAGAGARQERPSSVLRKNSSRCGTGDEGAVEEKVE